MVKPTSTPPISTKMTTKDSIIRDLYSTLEKIGYPETAQTRLEEFENIILNGHKRTDLLMWILGKCPNFNQVSFNKLKDANLSSKLFNCYNQIGLCNNEKILLGTCPTEEQLQFLHLLTTFLTGLHLTEITQPIDEKQGGTTYSVKVQHGIESNNNKDISFPTVKIETSSCNGPTSPQKGEYTNDEIVKKYDLDLLCLNANINLEKSKDEDISSYEPTLHKFNEYFKNTTSLSTAIGPGLSNAEQVLSSNIQSVHSAFLVVNKTFMNEVKIKNQQIPENPLTNTSRSLTQVIKNNLVTLEQACNILSNSEV